jgi:hypothetical protein
MAELMMQQAGTSADEPVLSYAHIEKRWGRDVQWLVGIVCVSQVFLLPDAVLTWLGFLDSPWSVLPRPWGMPRPPVFLFGLDYTNAVHMYGLKTLEPFISALVAGACAWYLVRSSGIGVLRFLSAALILLIGFDHLSLFGEERTTFFLVRHGYGMDSMYDLMWPNSQSLFALVLRLYPLLLLMMVLPRRSRKKPPAGVIWWTTAAALCAAAAPIMSKWTDDFPAEWYYSAVRVFSWWFGRSWEGSVFGVGDMARSLASVSLLVIVPWVVFRGPRGRPALMISAALLAVWACFTMFACMGCVLPRVSVIARLPVSRIRESLEDPASCLASGGIALAFPLAVRMALSLTEVRERLDHVGVLAAEMRSASVKKGAVR